MSSQGLQLIPGRWYGWQMYPGYSGNGAPYSSPIKVNGVRPLKTGRGILALDYFNASYAQGVQDFQGMRLRIVKHEAAYLVAELIYSEDGPQDRTAVISEISEGWIAACCPRLSPRLADGDIQAALERIEW